MVKKVRIRHPREEEEEDLDVVEDEMLVDTPKLALKPSRKRVREEEDEANEDAELEAEMAALEALRAEKETGAHPISSAYGPGTYNKEGLLKCLADWETSRLPFLETMQISDYEFQVENELDDLEREMSFYNHTLLAVAEGRNRLKDLGVPFLRPHDYFCEHMKSDAHMGRIKDRLLIEEKKMAAFEQRKLREENRKFNKQLAAKKKIEQSRATKETTHEIKSALKEKSTGKDDKEAKLEKILQGGAQKQSKKRKVMDRKYGFGGKDRKQEKRNDSKSTNDLRDFNPRGGKFVRNEFKGRGAKKAKKANRPGKDTRQKSRAARKSS